MLSLSMKTDKDIDNLNEITLTTNDKDGSSTIDAPLYLFMKMLHAAGYSREVIADKFVEIAKAKTYDAMIDIVRY